MLIEVEAPWCWACGRGERDRPPLWYAPWVVERAHLATKPRLEDRRTVILLCSGCHRASHGERIVGWSLPRLTLGNMLWLKRERDPAYLDLELLGHCRVGTLPDFEPLPAIYVEQYAGRRKRLLKPPTDCLTSVAPKA